VRYLTIKNSADKEIDFTIEADDDHIILKEPEFSLEAGKE